MNLSFSAPPSHAAYPENGRKSRLCRRSHYQRLPRLTQTGSMSAMATLIGAQIGQKAYGTAPQMRKVWLDTARNCDNDLQSLICAIEVAARAEADYGRHRRTHLLSGCVSCDYKRCDTVRKLRSVCLRAGLSCIDVRIHFAGPKTSGTMALMQKRFYSE